jgi:hypothetical protein
VFKRRSATVEAPTEPEVVSGKGRATPSRKEAEAARAARVKPPKDSREAKRLERTRTAEQRAIARKAMAAGDPRYLSVRDRGPARAWIRNYVDARWSPGELVLPAAFLLFVLATALGPVAYLVFYLFVIAVVFDSVVLARRISHHVKTQLPDEPLKGLRMYGILRASQFRRLRMPKPQVSRRPLFTRKLNQD